MWFRVLLAGIGLSALTACAVVDPVDNRYDTVSRSLAKARNEAIFLNLVRASHDYPLSFVTIANVTPSLSNTTSFGLPSFLLGPSARAATGAPLTPGFTPGRDAIFGNTTASNSTQVSTNFNVSTQETSAFYEGFLKPIDLQTLNYFIRQGYPRELLFWLFTDSFELTLTNKSTSDVAHTYGYHYNPPDDYGCSRTDPRHRCFVDWVHNAAYTGLTVEEKTAQTASSGGGAGGGGGGGGGGKGGGGSGGGAAGGKSSSTAYARFCFNPILAQQAQGSVPPELVRSATADLDLPMSQIFASQLTCGSDWDPVSDADGKPQPDILPLVFGAGNQIRIVPRSAYGVFEFLGTLMRIQRLHIQPSRFAYIPAGRPYAAKPPTLETIHEDPNLMTVLQNLGGECFVHTWFEDGDYCVPEEATTTKRVFGLLAQLIAIQTAATDLSITPVVRVLQ